MLKDNLIMSNRIDVTSNIINDKTIISKLIDEIDLWIWDFDDTLIDTIAYEKNMSRRAIRLRSQRELNQEFPNRKFFVDLVIKITNSGKQVAIASFGTRYIIEAYMKRLFGNNQKYFTKSNMLVIKRDPITNVPIEHPEDKNYMIRKLVKHYNIKGNNRVAFFDDQEQNIKMAGLIGINAIKIPGKYSRERQISNKCSLFCFQHIIHLYPLIDKNRKHKKGKIRNKTQIERFVSNKNDNYMSNFSDNLWIKLLLIIFILAFFKSL